MHLQLDGRRMFAALLAFTLAISVVVVGTASPAHAAPDLTVTGGGPGKVLFGDTASHSIEACNPGGPAGYNLSFRAVIGVNASYAGGGDAPSAVLVDAPNPGETTLLWDNVSDIPTGACASVAFDVDHETGSLTFDVGDSYDVTAGAYTNTDPRYVPDFDGSGLAIPGVTSYTGSGTDATFTEISAIWATKSEPSTEDELLRGVHDHQTTYTVTIQNNYVNPTSGVTVVDLLPAGLEFLGCGGDNTTDAPTNPAAPIGPPDEEYAGAGILNGPGALVPCSPPDTVETITQTGDVFTQVTWDNAGPGFDMASGDTLTFRYLAAIPIRENTTTWTGGAAPPLTGEQGANLDNNSGPETSESDGAEISLTNQIDAAGTYTRNDAATVPASDGATETVSAEDLSVHKAVLDGTIGQGDIETWVLTIESSEYRSFDNVVVTDLLPDGLCPLGLVNHDPSDPGGECDPTGDVPTIQLIPSGGPPGPVRSIDYTTVAEDISGTWTVTFDPTSDPTLIELASLAPSATVVVTIPTRTRAFYQQASADDAPVVANDSWENQADVEGTSLAPTIDSDQTGPIQVQDTSSIGQFASLPTIEKRVADPGLFAPGPLPTPCPAPPASGIPLPDPWGAYITGTADSYGPGDVACWVLRVDFPADVDTAGSIITDFLPPGHEYVDGSWQLGPGSVPASFVQSGDSLSWTLGSGGEVDIAQVAIIVFASEVDDPLAATSVDISGNLMKFQSSNTTGAVSPERTDADAEWAEAELALTKGVKTINGLPGGGNPADTDGGAVIGTDVVEYRIDLTNGGDRGATGVEVWDELPAQLSCAEVAAITPAGTCNGAEDRIEWTGLIVPAASAIELTYQVTIPAGIAPNETLANLAGVRSYLSPTNTGTDFAYYPASNIDPLVTPNTDAASDGSDVTTVNVVPAKVRTTLVTETGNGADEATIGERIDYTVTVTLPPLLTLASPRFVDVLGIDEALDPTSVTATLDDPAPGGTDITTSPDWDVATNGNTVTITYLAGAYTGDADGTTMTVDFSAVVANHPSNLRGGAVVNQATMSWFDQDGNAESSDSNQVSTTIVEPNLQIAKTETGSTTTVASGDVLDYRIRLTNPSAPGSVSPAHDVQVIDSLPADFVTPSAISSGGSWDPVLRAITWTGIEVEPDTTVDLTYTLTVDPDVPAGIDLPNDAAAAATSLAGVSADERTNGDGIPGYADLDGYLTTTVDASIAKAVVPSSATIGEAVQYSVDVTIPADTVMWDVQVSDLLPDGLIYDGTASVDCAGCVPAVTGTELLAIPNGDGTTTLGWWIGDVATSTADRTVTITYDAHVADEYDDLTPVPAGATPTNSAALGWNHTDTVIVDPVAANLLGATDQSHGPVTAPVTVVEPSLTIDKTVDGADGADAEPGASFLYTITVTNSGAAPAYDVTISDTPDGELVNVVPVAGAAEVTDGWSGGDPDIIWVHAGPIPPAGTLVYTYTADLAPAGALTPGDQADNTAAATEYFGRPEAERTANPGISYRTYADPGDSVTVDLYFPTATLLKTAADPTPTAVGAPFTWSITVTNTSPVASIDSLTVDDILPPNWTYDTASSLFDGVPIGDPVVVSDPTGDQLQWSGLVGLSPGGSATLTFTATPDTASQVDPGLAVNHENTAQASFTDASGATANAAGPYVTNQATAFTQLAVGSLGDIVWFDRNADGALDPDEYPLPGVVIELTWAGPDGDLGTTADNTTASALTAPDGSYSFANLPEGSFEVSVDPSSLPAGLVPSYDLDDTVTSPDGAWIGALGSGANRTDVDFGYTGSGTIGDTVWFDRDGDGVLGLGELPLEGVGLTLTLPGPDGVIGGGDDTTATATTNASGSYTFNALYDAEYQISVDSGTIPSDMAPTYDLDSGTSGADGVWQGVLDTGAGPMLDVDFGYGGDGVIGDTVWLDLNGDGVHDAAEPGLAGVTVELVWPGEDGIAGNADDTTVTTSTDAGGLYAFPGLPAGDYTVSIPSPPGDLAATFDEDLTPDGSTTVSLASAATHDTADFGFNGTASLGDLVWYDVNEDGVPDPTEPGLGAIEVTVTWLGEDLLLGGGNDVAFPPIATDASGGYLLAGLPAGAYVVEVTGTLAPGFVPTYDESGPADGSATIPSIATGEFHDTADFGFAGNGAIESTVWLDLNADGVRDPGEPGLPAVGVTATWAGPDGTAGTGDDVAFTTVTDSDGAYAFPNIPAGSYTVGLTGTDLPAGLASTYDLDGGGDGIAEVSILIGETSLEPAFGYVGPGSVGDTVWHDLDDDGIEDPGEPGVSGAGITVTHFGADGLEAGGDDLVFTTSTAADGSYLVDGLPDGPFIVTLDAASLAAGLTGGSDADGGDVLLTAGTLTGGPNLDIDFGVVGTSSLSGAVYSDPDGDGVLDPADGGIADVAITVTWDGPGGPASTGVVTGTDGTWALGTVPPGDYTIIIDATSLPEGYGLTTAATVPVTLPLAGSAVVESGAAPAVLSISGNVWIDDDGNGEPDEDETPLTGAITLYDGSGLEVGTTLSTEGVFSFDDLVPGTYTVTVDVTSLPAGLTLIGEPSVTLVVDATTGVAGIAFAFQPASAALPSTGFYVLTIALIGLVLVALGSAAVSLTRRRNPAPEPPPATG